MRQLIFLLPAILPSASLAQTMQKAEEPNEVGLVSVGDHVAEVPNGIEWHGFGESEIRWSRFEKAEETTPAGKVALRALAGASTVTFEAPAESAKTYRLAFWIKNRVPFAGRLTSESEEVTYGKHVPLAVGPTGGEWKRVRFHFRTAPGTTAVTGSFRATAGETPFLIGSPELREVTEDEFAAAYTEWRAQYPSRDLSPEPGFGRNLTNFVRKLTDPIAPEQPLRVMGIGSSYTNMLGNGERLIQWIRSNFPDAPPIHYEKHVGSAVNYDFTRGWMMQHVLEQQPDLVILYSGGTAPDLDLLLTEFRAASSADVIVASLHLREQDKEISDTTVNDPIWDEIRDVALAHECEWVDSRREWAAYLTEHEKPIEWLLKDAVHQNDHGALVINENIVRHLVRYEADDGAAIREIFVPASDTEGASMLFTGHRVDLVGKRKAEGGEASVEIDGVPADEFPAFHTTLIIPGSDNHKPARGSAADRSPHRIVLGDPAAIVPQAWTLRMTSDTGDYVLNGSVTGEDGAGNNSVDFTSDSGQITVPAALWRRRLESDGSHSNKTGDTFRWRVLPAGRSSVSFNGENGQIFQEPLIDRLPTGEHEVRVVGDEGGPIEIVGFVVHFAAGATR